MVDQAGNETDSTPVSVTYDHTPPVVSIDSGSKPGPHAASTSVTFTFTTDSGGVECKLDSAAYGACDTSTSRESYSGLTEGSHTFTVRATDGAGNSATDSYTWIVDHTAPTVSITGGKPAANTNVKDATLTFSVSDGTTLCSVDGGAFGSCTTSTTQTYTNMADGTHSLAVQSTDQAGNVGMDSYSWTVDTIAPVVTITSGKPAAIAPTPPVRPSPSPPTAASSSATSTPSATPPAARRSRTRTWTRLAHIHRALDRLGRQRRLGHLHVERRHGQPDRHDHGR